jgi:signal transduction histidine kinase
MSETMRERLRRLEAELVSAKARAIEMAHEREMRLEYEARLKILLEELRRSNEDLERFAHVVSHDLKEPLRVIDSYLQVIEPQVARALPPDDLELLQVIRQRATRMRDQIDSLLRYSRLKSVEVERKSVELRLVLDEARANLALAIEESAAEIRVDPMPRVIGDETLITALLQNLLSNAIKFRRAAPRIHVSAHRDDDGFWEIAVADDGIGIAAEDHARVFGVFERVGDRDAYPGSGVGLAICQHIVERHGGRIWVTSEPDQGSVFRFTLPGATDHVAAPDPEP